MNLAQRSLVGTAVIIGAHRSVGEEEEGPSEDDGLYDAVTELVGLDMKQVTPYLSAFASGFDQENKGGGAAAAAEQARQEAARRDAERAAATSRTTTTVILGVLGAGLLGAIVLLSRRK